MYPLPFGLAFPLREGREEGLVQGPPELPRVLLQFLGCGPEERQRVAAGAREHCVFGGKCQLLEQAAQVAATVEDLIARVPVLGLPAQSVHQLLPDRDDQLALRQEDLRGLVVAEAAVEDAHGLEECPEIEPAVFGEVGLLPGVLLTRGWGHREAGVLGGKRAVDKRRIPPIGWAWPPFLLLLGLVDF